MPVCPGGRPSRGHRQERSQYNYNVNYNVNCEAIRQFAYNPAHVYNVRVRARLRSEPSSTLAERGSAQEGVQVAVTAWSGASTTTTKVQRCFR